MALTLEQIKKLPPRERLEKLREFEAEQKKKREEEEKKQKKEEEEIVRRSLDEIAKEKEEQEEEEQLSEKKEQKPLEEIAEEAKPEKKTERKPEYQAPPEYIQNLSRRPMTEIYSQLSELREQFEERGYLTNQQIERAQNLTEAVYQKEKAGYKGSEKARFLMTEAEKIKGEMHGIFGKRYN